jgi:small subunit ribosomal protein S4
MGDPKKQKKKYQTPGHPWQKTRIDEEKNLIKEYGLKNKREIWKMDSKLRKFKSQVKKLITAPTKQKKIEKTQLLKKLQSLGLIKEAAQLDDVLSLTLKNVMERRLQTVLYRRGLAKTIKQARQMIVHQHVCIGNKKITMPSYLLKKDEEEKLSFSQYSPFSNKDHPARIIIGEKQQNKK